jgi:predicted TIM-barrel fold metal-dependent hydrolase
LIIDAHVHIGGPPPEAEPDNFIPLLRKSKVDKAVVFRYVPGQSTWVGNELIKTAVSRYPDHLIGFAWVDPRDDNATNEMRVAVMDWGFKGAKLHLDMTPVPIERLERIFAEAESLSVPLCIHVGKDFDSISELCGQYEVSIIVAHLGTGVYNLDPARLEKAISLSLKHDNIYLETSGNTYFFIKHAVKRLGASKIIFGSDFPHEHPLVMARAVDLLDLPAKDKESILGHNLRRLMRIP